MDVYSPENLFRIKMLARAILTVKRDDPSFDARLQKVFETNKRSIEVLGPWIPDKR